MSRKGRPGFSDSKGIIYQGFDGNAILAEGSTVPADASTGYAPGCWWFKRAGTTGQRVYWNDGTAASCAFKAIALTGAELALLSGLLATAAEINRNSQASTREVLAGATLSVTQALHDGKTIAMPAVCAVSLPASTGSGSRFKFYQKIAATAVTITATAADMYGVAWFLSDNSAAVLAYEAAGSTVITMAGSVNGGRKGAIVEIEDVATNLLLVRVMSAATGTEASPFS